MLLRAGIPAVRALDMVKDLLAAHLLPTCLGARKIEQGVAMSAALGAVGLATPVATRMMVVGERSGDMGQMLAQIARFHDDQTARTVEWFTKAFEPVLMAVLGLAIGGVVVLMYMPIFELAGEPSLMIAGKHRRAVRPAAHALHRAGRAGRRSIWSPTPKRRGARASRCATRTAAFRWCLAIRSTSIRRTGSRNGSPCRSATAWRAARR